MSVSAWSCKKKTSNNNIQSIEKKQNQKEKYWTEFIGATSAPFLQWSNDVRYVDRVSGKLCVSDGD